MVNENSVIAIENKHPQNQLIHSIELTNGGVLAVAGEEAPTNVPARHQVYPTAPVPGHHLGREGGYGHGEEAIREALAYAGTIFPDANLRLLSDEGSSAVVLEDDQGNIFKVYRNAHSYSYVENEMATLTRLSELGVAPKPYLLVDAAQERCTDEPEEYQRNEFGDTQIRRIKSEGAFPIIVMEKIDALPLRTLPSDAVIPEFDRLWSIFEYEDYSFGDTELVIDQNSGHAKFIDVGGISDAGFLNPTLHSLLVRYSSEFKRYKHLEPHEQKQAAEAVDNGVEEVHQFLKKIIAERDEQIAALGNKVLGTRAY